MISQELMLGDWVMLNPDLKEYYPFAGKSCMVIGLHDDDGAIKIEYDNGKYFWTDAEDDVIPIPLTPEILEKNGFENITSRLESSEQYRHLYEINDDIVIGELPSEFSICIERYNGDYDVYEHFQFCSICNVHELQQSMRLLGLRDLADNFVIEKGGEK